MGRPRLPLLLQRLPIGLVMYDDEWIAEWQQALDDYQIPRTTPNN